LIISLQMSSSHLIFVFAILALVCANDFDPNKVRLLNYRYNQDQPHETFRLNAIFRSNIPLIGKDFAFDEVLDAMEHSALRDADLILPRDNFILVDYSLLKPSDANLDKEKAYFEKHPDRGYVLNRPIYGTSVDPEDQTEAQIERMSESLTFIDEDLLAITNELESLLSDFSGPKNVYVLVHCQHGRDRAGEVSAAYWIARGFHSWEQVQATNYEIASGAIKHTNQRALTWFCHQLNIHRGYEGLTCTHENLSGHEVEPELFGWDQSPSSGSNSDLWLLITFPITAFVGVCALCILVLVCATLIVQRLTRESVKESYELPDPINV